MSRSARVELSVGARVLQSTGPAIVIAIERHGVSLRDVHGNDSHVAWNDVVVKAIADAKVQATHVSLEPWWSSLDDAARAEALVRHEVILEVLTGYRFGFPELAQPGEPHVPFGEGFGASMRERVQAMARQLSLEREHDRDLGRRVLSGSIRDSTVSEATIWNWLNSWKREGLRGLVDGRRSRGKKGFEAIDPLLVRIVDEELAQFDGSVSKVNLKELERRVHVRLKQEGVTDLRLPQRLTQQYLSSRYAALGSTARQHKSAKMRRQRGHASYPDTHPGHLAVDVTRADGLVWDEFHGRPYSVEIITFISVPTRVIAACRVVPRSANAIEVGMALYDAMRPFSMAVDGTTIDDFRWCGIPASLDFTPHPLVAYRPRLKTDRSMEGEHIKPGLTPKSIRADNGSIFVGTHLRAVLADLGVDLLTSRVGHPTDNAHVERWHETLQRAYQQVPGSKGRNVQERGRFVGHEAFEPLLTARELQQHLHRFIALDYHRSPHDGIHLPGLEGGRFTPLERFDMLSEATGRILVPQHPDLIYQFLPIRWLTPGNAGVTYRGLTYDGPIMDELYGLAPRTFRSRDDKVPFFYDPHDRSRLWHRSRHDGRVHELRWRQAHLVNAPLTDTVVTRARQLIRERGGNSAISKRGTMLEIVDALTELTTPPNADEWRAQLASARLRHEQALFDHAEADAAREVVQGHTRPAAETPDPGPQSGAVLPFPQTEGQNQAGFDWEAPWPDYRGRS